METEVGLPLEFLQNRRYLAPIKNYRSALTAVSLPHQPNLSAIRPLDQKIVGPELIKILISRHDD